MVGDNTKVSSSFWCDLQGKGKPQRRRDYPVSKGKETKGPKLKAGPSRDTTIMDSVKHWLEDCSSSSEKGEWAIIRRKRSHPVQGDEDKELEGLPTKKSSYGPGSCGCLEQRLQDRVKGEGEERLTDGMEEAPQNLTKQPKIQTEAFQPQREE